MSCGSWTRAGTSWVFWSESVLVRLERDGAARADENQVALAAAAAAEIADAAGADADTVLLDHRVLIYGTLHPP